MIIPSAVTLVADVTFFGRRSDKLGTLVFKDVLADKIVASKHIDSETANDYKQLAEELMAQGFVIQGVTIDGKRGVAKAFGSIPVQMFFNYFVKKLSKPTLDKFANEFVKRVRDTNSELYEIVKNMEVFKNLEL